jgi:hypothetical protein
MMKRDALMSRVTARFGPTARTQSTRENEGSSFG